MAPTADIPAPASAKKKERTWMPRMWIGMCFRTWLGLLIRNGFAVSPKYWIKGVLITLISLINSLLWLLEQLVFGLAIRRTKIEPRPLIVLGHWRSGSTMIGAAITLGGLLRLLPQQRVGLLAVRNRALDSIVLLGVGIGIIVLAWWIPPSR